MRFSCRVTTRRETAFGKSTCGENAVWVCLPGILDRTTLLRIEPHVCSFTEEVSSGSGRHMVRILSVPRKPLLPESTRLLKKFMMAVVHYPLSLTLLARSRTFGAPKTLFVSAAMD